MNLAAARSLYHKLCQRTDGYPGAVPIIHQAVVLKAVIDALDAALQEDKPENF